MIASIAFVLSSCGSSPERPDAILDQQRIDAANAAANQPAPAATQPTINTTKAPEPPQNAKGVWHYTCSAGCAGGAGSAGTCASCGGALAHNAEYHN